MNELIASFQPPNFPQILALESNTSDVRVKVMLSPLKLSPRKA